MVLIVRWWNSDQIWGKNKPKPRIWWRTLPSPSSATSGKTKNECSKCLTTLESALKISLRWSINSKDTFILFQNFVPCGLQKATSITRPSESCLVTFSENSVSCELLILELRIFQFTSNIGKDCFKVLRHLKTSQLSRRAEPQRERAVWYVYGIFSYSPLKKFILLNWSHTIIDSPIILFSGWSEVRKQTSQEFHPTNI